MDIGTLIAAALLSLGIIGTDAVLNADNISFKIEVSKDLVEAGYSPQLVDALMDSGMKELVDFKSIVRQPDIRSADQKSIVSAVAESVNLREVTSAFQQEFGISQVHLTGAVLGKDGAFRFLMSGDSLHTGKFTLDLHSKPDETLPLFLKSVAREVVARVEPYAAAIDDFNDRRSKFATDAAAYGGFRDHCEEILKQEAGQPDSESDHAPFHNLMGMAAMLSANNVEASKQFEMAAKMDPALGVPNINLALLRLTEKRFDDAIRYAEAAAITPYVKSKGFLLANTETIVGLAKWGKKDLTGAQVEFLTAVQAYPDSFWGYYYWSELQRTAGTPEDTAFLRDRADAAIATFETFPEVAFVYIRVDPAKDFTFAPIDVFGARHLSDIESP